MCWQCRACMRSRCHPHRSPRSCWSPPSAGTRRCTSITRHSPSGSIHALVPTLMSWVSKLALENTESLDGGSSGVVGRVGGVSCAAQAFALLVVSSGGCACSQAGAHMLVGCVGGASASPGAFARGVALVAQATQINNVCDHRRVHYVCVCLRLCGCHRLSDIGSGAHRATLRAYRRRPSVGQPLPRPPNGVLSSI